MNILQHPERQPEYRQHRSHDEFLCRIRDYLPSRSTFFQRLHASLSDHFTLQERAVSDAMEALQRPYRRTTRLLTDIPSSDHTSLHKEKGSTGEEVVAALST